MTKDENSDNGFEIKTQSKKAHSFHIPKRLNKPNILLLMTDQQRFDTINAAGYDHMQTDNLDRLTQEGRLYSHAYSPNPICLAARHNLLTGLPARCHGFPDNVQAMSTRSDLPTLPRILSDNGYDTRAIGKMHFRPARRHNGFLKMELMEELPKTRQEDEYASYLKEVGLGSIQNIHGVRNLLYMLPQRSLIPQEHHGTKWIGDRSVDYIRSNNGRQPFFLWASWIAPHPPFDVTDEFANLYKGANLPEPFESQTPLAPLTKENAMLGDIPNGDYLRRMRELYYAAITMVDEQVGRILDALEEVDQLDNTLIFFVSDHGEFLGDYGLYQKWNPYDVCARIPFIVRYPNSVAGGSISSDFVDLNDILPTVLDAAGLEYPESIELPGESLFSQNPQKDRQWQYVEYAENNRRWISIRNHSFKYNYYYGGGIEQLFDMQQDPHETTNLLHKDPGSDISPIRTTMRQKLVEYERRWGLEGYVGEDDLKVGPLYEPYTQRNEAFQRFVLREPGSEGMKTVIDGLEKEIPTAIAGEPVVRLTDLDIDAWQKNLNVPPAAVKQILAAAERMREEQPNHV